jgi:hypothetical protein
MIEIAVLGANEADIAQVTTPTTTKASAASLGFVNAVCGFVVLVLAVML